jgi:tetratricopeptide (TPR) repeat protein
MKDHQRSLRKIISALITLSLAAGSVPAAPTEAYQSYIRGLLAARAGDLQSALSEYQQTVERDRNAVLVYRDMAALFWQIGKPGEAFDAAKKLEELNGDSLATQLFLGNFYLLAGRSNRARESWEKVLKMDPNNETAILYLAAYHSSDNEPEKAITYWKKFVQQQPESAEGFYQMGITQEKLGELDAARESLQRSIALKPDSPEAHISLGQVYEKESKFIAAVEEYERYLALVPDNVTVLMYVGGLYYRLKNYPAAEETFLKVKKLTPDDASIDFWLGVVSEEKKDWDKAIEYFERLREKDETPVVLTRLSYYYSQKKKYSVAVKYLTRAAELEPQNPGARYLLGLAYLDQKKFKAAEQRFSEAITLKPDFAEAYFHRGIMYDQWGKFDRAVPDLEKAVQLNPDHAAALNYLGYSLADRGMRLDDAEGFIRRALEREPDNAPFMDSLAWVHFRKGRYQEAENELLKAAEKLQDAVVWDHLGDVRMQLHKTDDAWLAYRKALDLDPKNKVVARKVKALEKRVMPQTLQRQVLKRAEGNLLQIRTLRLNFTVKGETQAENFRFFGVFHYFRPDRWRIDVLGSFLAPQVVVIQKQYLEIYPPSLEERLTPDARALLGQVREFFNADFLSEFDAASVTSRKRGCHYIYEKGDRSLLIDHRDGTVREYKIKDRVIMRFKKYRKEEGLYLPEQIQLYSVPEKTSAAISLQGYILNQNLDESLFDMNAEETP